MFDIITIADLIPAEHRQSGLEHYYRRDKGWNDIEQAWADDEFAVDPTKINLYTGKTGIDGDTFKNVYLMDKHAMLNERAHRRFGLEYDQAEELMKTSPQLVGELRLIHMCSQSDGACAMIFTHEKRARKVCKLSLIHISSPRDRTRSRMPSSA